MEHAVRNRVVEDSPKFKYVFHLEDGRTEQFELVLDEHLQLANLPRAGELPDWARLENHRCPNCTLDPEVHAWCPVAVGISELLFHFQYLNSTDRARVEVHTPARIYVKDTDLQEGLFSIMGIIMPTSGCPALKFLRPMARFHLPFATIHETEVRSVSMFLLRQFFDEPPRKSFEEYLEDLNANYVNLQSVNRCLISRIRMMERSGDVNKNAVVILMVLSQMMAIEIKSRLKSFKYLFES